MRYAEFIKTSLAKYNPKKLDNKVLADDSRILAAWYASSIKKYSKEEILDAMVKVLREIARRVKKGKMHWSIHLDKLKPSVRKLYTEALKRLSREEREILVNQRRE